MVHHISCPNPYRRTEGMSLEDFCDSKVLELEDKILELGADNVAAFFAEPIFGAGGVIVPMIKRAEQLRKVRDATRWPPSGNRGVAFSRANLFGKNFDEYINFV